MGYTSCAKGNIILFSTCLFLIWALFFTDQVSIGSHAFSRMKRLLKIHASRSKASKLIENNQQRWLQLQEKYNLSASNLLSLLQQANIKSNTTLIYKCESYCGGFGDRLRGIISSYFLSLLSNRHFIIDMPFPCPITNFLQPNLYNWNISFNRTTMNRSKRKIIAIDRNNDLFNEIQNTSFVESWSRFDDIEIFTNLNFITAVYKNIWLRKSPIIVEFLNRMTLEEANINNLFPLFFEILFKPTKQVAKVIDSILTMKSLKHTSFLCLHIRKGRNPTIPNDGLLDRENVTDDIIRFIDDSLLLEKHNLTIIVASDSNAAVSQILNRFPGLSLTISGPILHVDKPVASVNHCEGLLKVLADFFILGECHTSILTGSGFSGFANRRRTNSYQNLYKYDSKGKSVRRCDNILLFSKWEPPQSSESFIYCPVTYNGSVTQIDYGL
jgi:hypothetical protein